MLCLLFTCHGGFDKGASQTAVQCRNTDMEMIGKRHPFAGEYKVAVQISTKKIVAMQVKSRLHSNMLRSQ